MPKFVKVILLFLFVVSSSYLVRDICYRREATKITQEISAELKQPVSFIPFLIESSMMYSYAEDVASGRGIKKFDDRLAGMSKVPVNQQFTNGLEYLLGYSYRLKNKIFGKPVYNEKDLQFEDNPAFASWCRVNIRLWASIISGLIFLWLLSLRIPMMPAFTGGLLHAFSMAALARYTGQDIVRGNLGLPLIVATFMLAYIFLVKPKIWKLLLTGLVAFSALAVWDMTQIVFAIWGITEIIRLTLRSAIEGEKKFNKRCRLWLTLSVATLLAAVIIPYHQIHLLILSPLMLIIFPTIFIMQFLRQNSIKHRLVFLLITLIGCYAIWWGISSLGSFGGNYGHFASLMKAKFQFLNVKPQNPELLDFDARSIWVPAMHSANRYIFSAFFPLAFNLTLVMLLATLTIQKMRNIFLKQIGLFSFPLMMFIFYGLSFFFIVRYHVFTIIFICLLLPMLLNLWSKNMASLKNKDLVYASLLGAVYFTVFNIFLCNKLSPKIFIMSALKPLISLMVIVGIGLLFIWLAKLITKKDYSRKLFFKASLTTLTIILLMTEFDRAVIGHERVFRGSLFGETAGLIKWFRQENMADEVVMADFQISPLLKAYCKSKIILQPKFELGATRENYRRFLEIIFHKTEKELAEFCGENNAGIFIFDPGFSYSTGIYSPRYIANALGELQRNSPAKMMQTSQGRGNLRNFYWIKPPSSLSFINKRYIVFKVITDEDKKRAAKWVKAGEQAFRNRNFPMAARLARSAIFADPLSPDAYLLYMQLFKKPPEITLRGF